MCVCVFAPIVDVCVLGRLRHVCMLYAIVRSLIHTGNIMGNYGKIESNSEIELRKRSTNRRLILWLL